MPPNLHIRLASLIDRVLDQVIVYLDCGFRIQCKDCASAVQESTESLPATNCNTLLDSWIVLDASYEHGANCNDGHRGSGGTFQDHDRAPILAIDIQCSFLVNRLWIDGIVATENAQQPTMQSMR